MKPLGLILKAARARQGLTQVEAAVQSGVAKGTVYNLENGMTGKAHAGVLAKLANLYELSLESLILAASSSSQGDTDNGQSGPESVAKPTQPAQNEPSSDTDSAPVPPIAESQPSNT